MFGEYLVQDVADFDVSILLEGSLASVVVAAPAPAEKELRTDGEWLRYRHAAARNFAWSASPHFEVATQTVQTGAGPVLLASYYFPFHAEAGQTLLATMAQALPLYAGRFGDYPHPQLTAVQADFLDGMEYDGLFFLSTDFYNWHKESPDDFLKALGAHETAHQWWMGLVGNDPALEPWLDEAFCTYSEVIFYETAFPEALDWWWTYRVNHYDPQGWIDIGIYDIPSDPNLYRQYRDPVYLRGAQFLQELRAAMGDEAFFAALRQYVSHYAYRHATAAGFFEIIQQHSPQDLSPILDPYFQGESAPTGPD
jgi:aminopeptidase N